MDFKNYNYFGKTFRIEDRPEATKLFQVKEIGDNLKVIDLKSGEIEDLPRELMEKGLDSGVIRISAGEIPGGFGKGKPDSDFDIIALYAGIAVELEHFMTPELQKIFDAAKEIAKDHMTESGPNYYRELLKMEKGLEK